MATTSALMTAEELLALPDDGIDRELIRGELREYSMTTRGVPHCRAHVEPEWFDQVPGCGNNRGHGGVCSRAISGSVFVATPTHSWELTSPTSRPTWRLRTAGDAKFIDGIPVLAIEILSPRRYDRTDCGEGSRVPRSRSSPGLGGQPVFRGGRCLSPRVAARAFQRHPRTHGRAPSAWIASQSPRSSRCEAPFRRVCRR